MTTRHRYRHFIDSKKQHRDWNGVAPHEIGDHLSPFQKAVAAFAIRRGRAAVFLDTGLGKTRVQLEWCKQAAAATNGHSIILTPLAVAAQIEGEGKALGYKCQVIREKTDVKPGINICNYDRIGKLDVDAFGAVSLDESSILKSFTGVTSRDLIDRFKSHQFRLAATATPAPNDHMELGAHAEFLGVIRYTEMLSRWFINDTSSASQKWRLKKHAERDFWDWMASWAIMASLPSDLGDFSDEGYVLAPFETHRHRVSRANTKADGGLFVHTMSATNMHDIKRQTIGRRAAIIAEIVSMEPFEPWVIWCDTDYEADALAKLIPDTIEVRGAHLIGHKEASLARFATDGGILITKPSICGYGLNWQHCARMAFVGRSFSYESFYQALRRCWRFGQKRPVHVHIIVAEGEDLIGEVIDRKAADHAKMKREMIDATRRQITAGRETISSYAPEHQGRLPSWLTERSNASTIPMEMDMPSTMATALM